MLKSFTRAGRVLRMVGKLAHADWLWLSVAWTTTLGNLVAVGARNRLK